MTVTVSDEIIKVLNALCEKFGVAIDWTNKNALPYLQELCDKCISYELWTSIFYIIVEALLIAGFVLLVYKTFIHKGDKLWDIAYRNDHEFALLVALIIYGIISVIMLFSMVFDFAQIITCLTFPEKVILEFIKTIK